MTVKQLEYPVVWRTVKLSEVCEIVNGGTPKTGVSEYWNGKHLWITPAEMGKRLSPYVGDSERKISDLGLRDSSARLLPPHSVILSSRAPIGHLVINIKPMATNQGCKGLIPNSNLDYKFLYYYLYHNVDLLNSLGTGATFKELSGGKLKEVEIPLPPLSEQQRIVAILDEAFAAIATARASAERNLQSTRELFESYLQLVFTQAPQSGVEGRGDGWEEKRLGDLYDVRDGTHDSPKYHSTGYPLITSKNLKREGLSFDDIKLISEQDYKKINERSAVHKGDVLFAMIGTIGNPTLVTVDPNFAIKNVALFKIPDNQNGAFLRYYLASNWAISKMINEAKGTTQKFVGLGYLRDFPINLPPLPIQKEVVRKLNELSEETQKLEDIYRRKIAALDELKKSLLEQAFKGELTGRIDESVVIPFPVHIPNISTTDLHAGILALAYQMHEKSNKQKYFGHVKAEKIAHMIEAYVGIELDRVPVKDAAGPNDYKHLKKIEHRAKMAGFFTFHEQTGGGYIMTKAGGFDSLVNKTRTALGELNKKVDDLINLMLPMDTQQAEIFATVYAAWNNLLIDKETITDERIVSEARENWHPDKLKIPRERFFAAITWLREKEIVPKGLGKKVIAKVQKP